MLDFCGLNGDFTCLVKQWQAVIFPLALTSLIYAGSMTLKLLSWVDSWREDAGSGGGISSFCLIDALKAFTEHIRSRASNVLFWRNFVVVSVFILLFSTSLVFVLLFF